MVWKKDEEQVAGQSTDVARPKAQAASTGSPGGRATIGPSITIRGDVTGSEDLLIEGSVDGSVSLDKYALSVGSQGRVSANITARQITIEGEVDGDLTAQDQIALLPTAKVKGDIKAPRVVLQDGASFRGLVDMGAAPSQDAAKAHGAAATGKADANGTDAPKQPSAGSKGAPVTEAGRSGPSGGSKAKEAAGAKGR